MTTQATNKLPSPIDIVRNDLQKMEGQLMMALPSHIKPDKFIRVTMTALQNNPDLMSCDRMSLYNAVMRAAQDGLLPDGRESAIVKYGNKASYQMMVGGVCKKARNSGEIKDIDAQVVHENDEYTYWTDETGAHFRHVKARQDRGAPVSTYAYARTKEGGFYFEELSEEEIQDVRKVSKSQSGPWNGPFASEMRRKTAIRRLAKYRLPSSTDLDEAIRADDDLYELEPATHKASSLSARLHAKTEMDPGITSEPTEFEQAAAKAEAEMRMK